MAKRIAASDSTNGKEGEERGGESNQNVSDTCRKLLKNKFN